MKEEDYKRQLIIANSLYELGLDIDLIKKITTVESKDLNLYREKNKNNTINIDKKKDKSI